MADNILRNIKKQNKKKVLVTVKERMAKAVPAKGEYTEAVGRRKTAIARVRLYAAKKNEILVNGISAEEYFKAPDFVRTAGESLGIEENKEKYSNEFKTYFRCNSRPEFRRKIKELKKKYKI